MPKMLEVGRADGWQVLGYTFLDVIAKGISLSLCFCGSVFQLLCPHPEIEEQR